MIRLNLFALLGVASIVVIACLSQVSYATTKTSSSPPCINCSLRQWLSSLKQEASELECTASQLEVSIGLLSKANYPTTSKRNSQLDEIKKELNLLRGEIEIISSACSTFYGPYCNETAPECSANCLTCNAGLCSQCKLGWNGTECNTPICSNKCQTCTSPGVCSVCSGNWIGTTCSTCKSGWSGNDCTENFILSSAQITKFTKTILPKAQISSNTLMFKATRDGFSASTFHRRCDERGPTFVIIKATTGAIFGGYTSVSWRLGGWVSDQSAFIFSLVSANKEERFVKFSQENAWRKGYDTSISSFPYIGPSFGYDIHLEDNANTNSESYANLCHSYCDKTMKYNTDTTNSYLAGTYHFQVEDYEVYRL